MKTTFEIDQTIALISGESYYDLHNCYDFVGFNHLKRERRVICQWTVTQGDWVSDSLPKGLSLTFNGVKRLKEKERDPKMPKTEDLCLSSISFSPPDFENNYDDICPEYRSDEEHMSLTFESGACLKIWADSVSHEIRNA